MELSKQEMELFLTHPGLLSKNFCYDIFFIFTKEFKIDFQNRKWNYPNRKWNYFSHFQADDQKATFTKFCFISTKEFKIDFQNRKRNYLNRKWNYFSYFQASYQKKIFYNIFFIFTRELKIDFQNRKWNYPNRIWNYFSNFQVSAKKFLSQKVFNKCFKIGFQTGKGIIQEGKRIISPTARSLLKKLLLQDVTCFYKGIQNLFSKQEIALSK